MMSTANQAGGSSASSGRQAVSEASPSRVVPKPVPQSQEKDARGYHIAQIKRRFSAKESALKNGSTSLVFAMVPSDPDFPFDLPKLECEVRVPAGYPEAAPTLSVKNSDIPRGFAVNIEKGWDKLVQEKRGATLLALANALDKNLESFLAVQKAETVKLTIYKDARHLDGARAEGGASSPARPTATSEQPPEAAPATRKPYLPEESFTREEVGQAKARRAQEVRQLETRMGRDPAYHKSSDGIVYTLPLEPRRRADLPPGLRSARSFQLIVPLLYPLQAIRILLSDVESEDAELVEELFVKRAAEQKQMSLMSHINYLAQNLHALAKQAKSMLAVPALPQSATTQAQGSSDAREGGGSAPLSTPIDDEKSHIHVIPRPPEWTFPQDSDDSESDSDSGSDDDEDYSYDDSDDSGGGGAVLVSEPVQEQQPAGSSSSQAERGTALFFPSVELRGIELLQVSILGIAAKCERCKTVNEIGGLKPNLEKTTESCRKCATPFTVRFRPELVHQNSTRAGFIDVSGCTVAEMLPR